MIHSGEVIEFWFNDIEPSKWWVKDEDFDDLIRQRFQDLHNRAIRCELYGWREQALGRLAEIIVLDQFSRNIYRDQPESFQYDGLALCLAQEAVALAMDQQLEDQQKSFIYMPYMHSESALIHRQAEILFKRAGLKQNYEFELKHKLIIDRFGRYPHRNQILNRQPTAEELEFLKQPGSSF